MGEWPKNVRRGHVHGGVRGREVRQGAEADRWGPRASEGEYANGRSTLTERTHRAERGSEHAQRNRHRQAGCNTQIIMLIKELHSLCDLPSIFETCD